MMNFETSLAFSAITAAKELFTQTVSRNQSGLVVDNEFVAIESLIEGMGMNVWMNINPDSLYWAIINQATIGLSVEAGIGHATFINRFDFATNLYVIEFMPIYHGLIHLAFESGLMSQVSGDVVRQGEEFRYNGPEAKPDHHYTGSNYGTSDVISAYACATLKSGQVYTSTVTLDELIEAEQIASFNVSGNDNVWNTGFKCEMQKKTAIRRLMRTVFNQLGFHDPIYRERIRMLMSVEDNLWNNLKSGYQAELERVQRERKLTGKAESNPSNGRPLPLKRTQSRSLVSSGLRAVDVINKAKESDQHPQASVYQQSAPHHKQHELVISTSGFMSW
jgi:phage RecT family recombinase